MNGTLFSQDFLATGIAQTMAWDASHVLDQFPIVRKKDEAAFAGRYRTKELVLAYYNAVAAGDMDSRIAP